MNNLGCIRELQVMRLIPDEIYEFESIFFFSVCALRYIYMHLFARMKGLLPIWFQVLLPEPGSHHQDVECTSVKRSESSLIINDCT